MKKQRLGLGALAAVTIALAAVALTTGVFAGPAHATSGAGFTTVDETIDGSGHCQNGNPAVNCNIYDGKQFVWMNGGPVGSSFGDGTYFFAVLAPSGQSDPNDGSPDLLSVDAYSNRTFSVTGGALSYNGTHNADLPKIRLAPYLDTPNPGGVYIMAICSLANGYPVDPSDCKYDAFKVQSSGGGGAATALTVTKDAAGSYTDTFTWGIQKSVDTNQITTSESSGTFNYTVTVTHDTGTVGDVKVTGTIDVFNPNVGSVTGVDVTDTLSDNTVCSVTDGTNQTVATGTTSFDYECDLSSLPQGELDNTATVTWPDQTIDDGSLSGGTASFTFNSIGFTASNVDDCAEITDTVEGDLGAVCSSDPSPTTFNYPVTVDGTPGTCVTQDNTATFTTNTTGTTGDASQSVQLCEGEDLTVSKDATPSYTRTYNWSIQKSVDKTRVEQSSGTATFNYTVNVKQTGASDSAVQATGTITVTNPNDFEAITLTGVSDAVDNGGTCSITGGDSPTSTIPASGSVTLDYTCTYSAIPAKGTNTATAAWDSSAASTSDGSAQGTAAVAFGAPTSTVNKTITPTDAFNGGLGVKLCALASGTPCTLTGTDSSPFTSQQYKYARNISVTADQCLDYPNTAATGTGPTSSQTVTVCGPVAGGLTMGFWQNNNGQAIIKAGASTGGVCNSGTWLRSYAPFQDLSATASCNAVATYVFNVIKGGGTNCGGSTCNALLKAQMLATALDVYFSTPGLGGNKIGAPSPLGGVNVDITSYSAAFGGSTCLTVSQMLSYAASKSNSGGSGWYGQNKAVQVLAKSAFDAINNQQAFTC